jgi:hypothetical protein
VKVNSLIGGKGKSGSQYLAHPNHHIGRKPSKLFFPFLCTPISEFLMTEERKHALLFAATLLCARKMIEIMDSDKPNFAKQYWKAVDEGAFILERIDKRWPLSESRQQ